MLTYHSSGLLAFKDGHFHSHCSRRHWLQSENIVLQLPMTSSHGSIFRAIGPWWDESTGDRWIPLTTASDAELFSVICAWKKKTVEQKIKVPVIWNAIALIMTPFQWESDESNTHCVFGAPVLRWWQWLTPSYWPPWLRLYQKGMCGDSTHGNARLLCPWAAIIDNFTVGEKRPHAIINRSLDCWINVTFYMIYLGLRGVKKSHWHFHQLVPIYW